jgi:hypothetical protein
MSANRSKKVQWRFSEEDDKVDDWMKNLSQEVRSACNVFLRSRGLDYARNDGYDGVSVSDDQKRKRAVHFGSRK